MEETSANLSEDDVAKKNAVSIVLAHFGFCAESIEQKEVKCKYCRKTVLTTAGDCMTVMEDSIEVILQDNSRVLSTTRDHPLVTACTGAMLTGIYGLWSMFALPGFRKVPWNLKVLDVPYLPSSKDQTLNTMKLLEGRSGRLADLGSGDGRLVFAASSAGFQCTGFEINSILVSYARSKARWKGVPPSQAAFVKKDFWKIDLSSYNNVTAFLAPGVMKLLGEKLLKELPKDARVIACRFPFPDWPQESSAGSGLDQTFAYDIEMVRSHLKKLSVQ